MQLRARVDREEALAFLGHRGQGLGEDLAARLERAATLCESELTPRGVERTLAVGPLAAPAAGVRLAGGFVLPGRDIAAHLAGCSEVVLMAVTLGAESEMLLRREAALSPTDGLLVDACASSLVEQAANALNDLVIAQAAERGLAATTRFSPGYGDLPLSCQPAFLAACGADRVLGLRATEAHLLVPAKSITAVIGLRPQPPAPGAAALRVPATSPAAPPPDAPAASTPCATCPLAPDCALRAQGRTCYGTPA